MGDKNASQYALFFGLVVASKDCDVASHNTFCSQHMASYYFGSWVNYTSSLQIQFLHHRREFAALEYRDVWGLLQACGKHGLDSFANIGLRIEPSLNPALYC